MLTIPSRLSKYSTHYTDKEISSERTGEEAANHALLSWGFMPGLKNDRRIRFHIFLIQEELEFGKIFI